MFGLFKKSGPKKASINSGQHEVTVEPNQNLLDAALKAGINFPHDCRVGSCGSCTCKLTKGKIKKLTDFSYVLTLDQLNDGMILACQSRLKTDVNIEVNIDESAKKTPVESFTGKVKSEKLLTYDIVELTIELENSKTNENILRQARYEAFFSCLKKGDVLCTAHHQDDHIETILFRILRGTVLG